MSSNENYLNILAGIKELSESELCDINHEIIHQLKAVRDRETSRKRNLLSAGDKVSWSGRYGYQEGTIVRVKRKKAIVDVGSHRNWDVPLSMLKGVVYAYEK